MTWLHHLWFGYFYPSLQGNGPEDIFRTTIALILAALIVPRIRHFLERHFDSVKAHVTAEHERLHSKLDHIIKHHPDIPPFEEKP